MKTKRKPHQWRKVGLARVSHLDDQTVVCTCGWDYHHERTKVREDAIDKHFAKRQCKLYKNSRAIKCYNCDSCK